MSLAVILNFKFFNFQFIYNSFGWVNGRTSLGTLSNQRIQFKVLIDRNPVYSRTHFVFSFW